MHLLKGELCAEAGSVLQAHFPGSCRVSASARPGPFLMPK